MKRISWNTLARAGNCVRYQKKIGFTGTVSPERKQNRENKKSLGIYHLITVLGSRRSQSCFAPFPSPALHVIASPWNFVPRRTPALELFAQKLATFAVCKLSRFMKALTQKMSEVKYDERRQIRSECDCLLIEIDSWKSHREFQILAE